MRHLARVAAGLRSRIWGEDQIVTQVKTAIAASRENGGADPVLETLFRTAVSASKAVKTKARLTALPTSAASRAVEVLERETGGLAGRKALVIGNGEMGRLAASLLREAGCAVTVTLRSYHHGETVVPAGCAVAPYEERYAAMEGRDILLSATTSPHYTVSAPELSALSAPPALLVDLAIPRDIQPEAGDLPGVKLFNVDALGAAPERQAPPEVEEILESQIARFYQWADYRESLPLLERLKADITDRVLERPDLEELDKSEVAEYAVCRAVELLAGGLKDVLTAGELAKCEEKIRTRNGGRVE